MGKHTTNLTPVLLTRRLYFLPRAIHDPGHVSLRRGLRAALVVSLLLAFATRLGLDQSFATFLVFGGMALLVLADFGGPSRSRVLAYLTTVLVGIPLVAVGTLASGNVWTAIVATAAVTFAVTEVAVLGGYFATAQTGLLLAFVLAVSSVGSVDSLASRVAGWSLAGAVSILAGWLLWPRSSHAELRATAASVLRALSGILSSPSTGDSIGTRTEFEAAGRAALVRLRGGFLVAQRRPAGATQRDRGFAELATDLERALDLAVSAQHQGSGPPLMESAQLTRAIIRAFETSAALLEGKVEANAVETLVAARDEHRVALDRWATQALLAGAAPESVVDALTATQPLRAMSYVALTVAQDAEVAAGRPLTGSGSQAIRRGLRSTLAEELTPSSIWLRNGLRTAVGLALAVLVARSLAVPYAFWVVLGTISALRSNASGTGRSAVQALGGTALGVLVAVPFVGAAGGDVRPLWSALPFLVFLAAYTPAAVSFVVGQVAFSLLVVVLFNILAPTDWQIGLARVEDAALGVGVSAVVGLLLWPRGARGQLRSALATMYSADALYLSASLRRLLGQNETREVVEDLRAKALTESIRAGEVFDLVLSEGGTRSVPVEVWSALLSGGKRLLQIGETLDWLANHGYAATAGGAPGSAIGGLADDALADVVRLAGEVKEGRLLRILPTHERAAERRAAAVACLAQPNIADSREAMRSAIGLVAASDWLAQIETLVEHLEIPLARAAPSRQNWWH